MGLDCGSENQQDARRLEPMSMRSGRRIREYSRRTPDMSSRTTRILRRLRHPQRSETRIMTQPEPEQKAPKVRRLGTRKLSSRPRILQRHLIFYQRSLEFEMQTGWWTVRVLALEVVCVVDCTSFFRTTDVRVGR